MATVYDTERGEMKDIQPNDGKAFTLEELQGIVGGLIQLVYTYDGKRMYVNEEGKLQNLPYNALATAVYRDNAFDRIVGNAIVIEDNEDGADDDE